MAPRVGAHGLETHVKMTDKEALAMYRRSEFPNETELSWPAAVDRRAPRHAKPQAGAARRPDRTRKGLAASEAPGD